MRSTRVAIVGSGGHGREILQVFLAAQRAGGVDSEFAGFFDDRPDESLLHRLGTRCLGGMADAASFDGGCWLGLGAGALKERFASGVLAAPPLVHPMADVGTDVTLSPGTVVFAQSTVTTNISLGVHVHVGRGAAVGHDSVIHDFASIMPLASISGSVEVGERAFVGTGAAVRQGLHLGADSTVGMGAVVLNDVPQGATVFGNPARVRSGG